MSRVNSELIIIIKEISVVLGGVFYLSVETTLSGAVKLSHSIHSVISRELGRKWDEART